MPESTLTMNEGVLLAHALVAHLADQLGVPVLFIKGPTAVAQGVRPERDSSDVDVLVNHAAFAPVTGALRSRGWVSRFDAPTFTHASDLSFEHSEHLIHPEWPCDIDVHFSFPGFLHDPEDVFSALWDRRASVVVAGRTVPAADVLGQALVVGLHALRDPSKPSSLADLMKVRAVVKAMAEDQQHELVDLAVATGSLHTAAPVLPLSAGSRDDDAEPPGLSEWQFRQTYGEVPLTMWLVELRTAPWRRRPAVLRQALFPTRRELERQGYRRADGLAAALRLHQRRWARSVRALPTAVRGVFLARALQSARRQ